MADAPDPEPMIVPHVIPEQPLPETFQLIAEDGFDPGMGVSDTPKLAVEETATEEGPLSASVNRLVMLTEFVATFDGSAALTALSRSVAGEGSTCGAVRTPAELMLPQAPAKHPAPAIA